MPTNASNHQQQTSPISQSQKIRGVFCILIAAVLFGCVSLFLSGLTAAGTTRLQIIMLRSWLTTFFLFLLCVGKNRKIPAIKLRDSWIFIAYGTVNMVAFSLCYWKSMALVGVSVSSILIYTAPVFALIISAFLFGEKINRKCIIALILALFGVACVSGFGNGSANSPFGFFLGIFAGFLYSLQGIWNRLAIQHGYGPRCITLYANLVCAFVSTPLALTQPLPPHFFSSANCILLIVGMSLFCIMVPNMLFAKGLETVPAGRASMLTSTEPAAATLIGVFVFGEKLTAPTLIGILVIVVAVCLLVSDKD